MITKIKRPKVVVATLSLEKLKADCFSIPLHLIFKTDNRKFAEAAGHIVVENINDHDKQLIYKGVDIKRFFKLLNLPAEELEVIIHA